MRLGPEIVMTACLGLVVVVLVLGLAGVYFILSNEQEELTYRIAQLEQVVEEQAKQLDLERRSRHTPVIKLEPEWEIPPAEYEFGECAPLIPRPRTKPLRPQLYHLVTLLPNWPSKLGRPEAMRAGAGLTSCVWEFPAKKQRMVRIPIKRDGGNKNLLAQAKIRTWTKMPFFVFHRMLPAMASSMAASVSSSTDAGTKSRPVIVSYRTTYRRESSSTSSRGASGRVLSL